MILNGYGASTAEVGGSSLTHPFLLLFMFSAIACVFVSFRHDALIANFGAYQFATVDFFVFASSVTALRLLTAKTFYPNTQTLLIAIFLLLFLSNLFRGIAANGLDALIALRLIALLPLALLFFFAPPFTKSDNARLVKLAGITGCALSLIVLARIVVNPGLGMAGQVADGLSVLASADAFRALPAQGSYLLGLCALVLISARFDGEKSKSHTAALLATGFVICLLLTRQLTAITATFSALAVYFLYDCFFNRDKLSTKRLAIVFAIGCVVALLALIFGITNIELVRQYFELRAGSGAWRQAVWLGIWESVQQTSIVNQMFGFPTGPLPEVYVQIPNRELVAWQFQAHSFYLEALRLYGWIGCITLATLAIWPAFQTLVKPDSSKALGLALLVGFAVFGYGYSQFEGSVVMLILGMRLCLHSARNSRPLK